MPKEPALSQSKFALMADVSKRAISKAFRKGALDAAPDGGIDLTGPNTVDWLDNHRDNWRDRGDDLTAAKAAKLECDAGPKERQYRERQNGSVDAKTAKRHVAAIVSAVSEQAQRMKLRDRIAAEIADLWASAPRVTEMPDDEKT